MDAQSSGSDEAKRLHHGGSPAVPPTAVGVGASTWNLEEYASCPGREGPPSARSSRGGHGPPTKSPRPTEVGRGLKGSIPRARGSGGGGSRMCKANGTSKAASKTPADATRIVRATRPALGDDEDGAGEQRSGGDGGWLDDLMLGLFHVVGTTILVVGGGLAILLVGAKLLADLDLQLAKRSSLEAGADGHGACAWMAVV